MPAHSYRVNNCGSVDLVLEKFIFNTPPGIRHVANLTNFGGTANFSGNTFTVSGIAVPPDEYKTFTVDYQYVSGPSCCQFGNIIISTVTGKTNTIFTTINVSDQCIAEAIVAQCSLTPGQPVINLTAPVQVCSLQPSQPVWRIKRSKSICAIVPNQATWSWPVPEMSDSCSLVPNLTLYNVTIPLTPTPPEISCSLLPNNTNYSVPIPVGSWSVTAESPTSRVGGSEFKFNWTAPSTAVGTRIGWFIVAPGTKTPFSSSGISSAFLGAASVLSVMPSLTGSVTIQTNRITSTSQSFQLILVSSDLSSVVLARSATCTITV